MAKWIAASMLSTCTAIGFAAAMAEPGAMTAPPAEEPLRAYLQRDFSCVESPEIDVYLRSVAEKLLRTRSKPPAVPRIVVYSSTGFNAMADSEKNILISTEVLQQLQSEDELAALLGHELTHVMLRHTQAKSRLGRFPLSIETMGELAATADQIKADHANGQNAGAKTAPAKATQFATESVRTSQNVSLFWSDLLMPNWNRDDEREADRVGYEMMRAAGYDPEAFTTLLQKLHAAQLKRSERMEQLRVSMIKRAQQRERLPAGSGEFAAELHAAREELRKAASEKAVNALFDGIAQMGKNYDSPEKRQDLLRQHEAKLPPLDGDKKPRSPLFAKTLREGPGGGLLSADRAALSAVAAMEAGDTKLAQETLAPLLPKAAAASQGKAGKGAAGKSKGKKSAASAPLAKTGVTVAAPLASPHLNFAVGKWLLEQGKPEAAEVYAKQWLNSPLAPAKAFLWNAAFQADRTELVAANQSLENAGRRLGSNLPFLPTRVAYTRQANDMPRAQALTLECRVEEQKRRSFLQKVIDVFKESPPTGLYAQCLASLGSALPEDESGLAKRIFKLPFHGSSEAVEGLKDGANK